MLRLQLKALQIQAKWITISGLAILFLFKIFNLFLVFQILRIIRHHSHSRGLALFQIEIVDIAWSCSGEGHFRLIFSLQIILPCAFLLLLLPVVVVHFNTKLHLKLALNCILRLRDIGLLQPYKIYLQHLGREFGCVRFEEAGFYLVFDRLNKLLMMQHILS